MTKKLERIQLLLLSTDPELQKFGQKLCHKFRIDYYIECMPCSIKYQGNRIKVRWHSIGYSLKNIEIKVIQSATLQNILIRSELTLQRIYKIKLCKKS